MNLILISYLPDFSVVYLKVNLSLFFALYSIYASFLGPYYKDNVEKYLVPLLSVSADLSLLDMR